MTIPTEPIGSIPRPSYLIEAIRGFQEGRATRERLDSLYAEALRDTIQRFEATGSPVITDGEQTKPSFATYPIHGLTNLAPDGISIPLPMAMCANCPGWSQALSITRLMPPPIWRWPNDTLGPL